MVNCKTFNAMSKKFNEHAMWIKNHYLRALKGFIAMGAPFGEKSIYLGDISNFLI